MARHPAKRPSQPLAMRLAKDDIAIIDRAARIQKRTRAGFVRDAAVRAAEKVVLETTVIRLAPDAFKAFVESLDRPPVVVPDIVRIMQMKAPWEK